MKKPNLLNYAPMLPIISLVLLMVLAGMLAPTPKTETKEIYPQQHFTGDGI